MMSIRKIVLLAGAAMISPLAAIDAAAAQDAQGQSAPQSPPSPPNAQAPAESAVPTPTTTSAQDGDIIVTALRGQTVLQRTPAAVTALSGQDLQSRGITDIQNLATAVPGVSFGQNLGQAHIAIRGIGSDVVAGGQDPRVAFYQDGVYIARLGAQLTGLFDVDQIQVLQGPQGTLYGRNATGGAVVVTSRRPTDTVEGYVRAGYGNYNAVNASGAIGGPLSSTLSARVAVDYQRHDGYGTNLVSGRDIDDKDQISGRFTLAWRPSSNLEFLTVADYSREADRAYGTHLIGRGNPAVQLLGLRLGGTGALNSRDIASDTDPAAHNRSWGVTEQISVELDGVKVQSITAYREFRSRITTDVDGTSVQLAFDNLHEDSQQVSQETTFSGTFGKLDWLAGGLYFHERNQTGAEIPINLAVTGGPLNLRQGLASFGDLSTDALSGYARLAYTVVDGLKVTVGGRYNYEKKRINDIQQFDFSRAYSPGAVLIPVPPFPRLAQKAFTGFTPSGTIEYQVNPAIFTYVTVSRGFKSGGFNVGVNQPAFKPETITNYEGGIKTSFDGGRFHANLIGFHYDYSNLQVSQIRNQTTVIENAASARINGFNAELNGRLAPGVTLGGTAAYVGSSYRNFTSVNPIFVAAGPQDVSGKDLTQAPKFSFTLFAEGRWAIGASKLIARGDYSHYSKQYFSPFNEAALSQGAYGIGTASIRFEMPSGWSLDAYIRNIGNEKAVAQSYVSSALFGYPVLGVFVPPRTFGFSLERKF